MQLGGIIRGVVRDAANNPIQDAAVMIVTGPAHHDIAALTDASGAFDFGDVTPGRYVIQARGEAVMSESIQLTVRPARVSFVQIWLEADLDEGDLATGEADDYNGDSLPRLPDAEPGDFADELY